MQQDKKTPNNGHLKGAERTIFQISKSTILDIYVSFILKTSTNNEAQATYYEGTDSSPQYGTVEVGSKMSF